MIISYDKTFCNLSLFVASGGLIFWADTVGPKYIYERLKRLSETYGAFFKPSRYLEERAMKGMFLVMSLSTFFSVYDSFLIDRSINDMRKEFKLNDQMVSSSANHPIMVRDM